MNGVLRNVATEVNRQIPRQLDYELLAGWRLGFDFAYVWHENTTKTSPEQAEELSFDVSMYVCHSNDPDWHPSDEVGPVRQYDLRELTREQVREVGNGRR